MALRAMDPPTRLPAGEPTLREVAVAIYDADLMLVRYIDRRKPAMPADLAAYCTALRDSRLQAMRETERRFHLPPYERA